ncbi:MAG TPA: glycosyltransferase [Candidatus Nanoarchaeia archaeon]|nr:hypothetical protein [uncultured archaeon]
MDPNEFLSKVDFKKPPSLTFLKRLTNHTGIIQHAKFAVPDRNLGYSVDDNARGLLVSVFYHRLFGGEEALDLGVTYLSFIDHAKTTEGWFYNFLSFDNKFLDQAKTEDGFGRVFWALSYTAFAAPRRDLTLGAKNLVAEVKGNIQKLEASRAKAYCLAGLTYLSQMEPNNEEWKKDIIFLADSLVELYKKNAVGNWRWFEPYLTYANGIFPYVLTLSYQATFNNIYLEAAKKSLEFLEKETATKEGIPSPIGQGGWYFKGKRKAAYDQQPLEAADMVIANLGLYKVTFDHKYQEAAKKWFAWYWGYNAAGLEIYDEVTHGCFDGINPEGVNLNQGAESIVTYLMAYLAFSDIELKLG